MTIEAVLVIVCGGIALVGVFVFASRVIGPMEARAVDEEER